MGRPKQDSQGDGKKKGKKDGGAKAGRNKNPEGKLTTAKNRKRRILSEAHRAEKKLRKLVRRNISEERQKRIKAHISRLNAQAKSIF